MHALRSACVCKSWPDMLCFGAASFASLCREMKLLQTCGQAGAASDRMERERALCTKQITHGHGRSIGARTDNMRHHGARQIFCQTVASSTLHVEHGPACAVCRRPGASGVQHSLFPLRRTVGSKFCCASVWAAGGHRQGRLDVSRGRPSGRKTSAHVGHVR